MTSPDPPSAGPIPWRLLDAHDDHGEETPALCPTADLPDGQGLQVTIDDFVMAVFKVGDRDCVIDDHRTHGPELLSEGEVDGKIVECPFHHGAFNIRTGQVVAPPCMVPVRTCYAEVREGQIYIDRDRPAEP